MLISCSKFKLKLKNNLVRLRLEKLLFIHKTKIHYSSFSIYRIKLKNNEENFKTHFCLLLIHEIIILKKISEENLLDFFFLVKSKFSASSLNNVKIKS